MYIIYRNTNIIRTCKIRPIDRKFDHP